MLYPTQYGDNSLFPQSKDFKVIFKDANSGKGVFCYRSFKKGEVMAAMAGEIIQEIMQHTLQIDNENHLYDIYFSGYFLHACDPNIVLDMQNLTVTAVKDIPANSWLYMDYSETEDVLFQQFPCSCESYNCRGWIVGKNEISSQLLPKKSIIRKQGIRY